MVQGHRSRNPQETAILNPNLLKSGIAPPRSSHRGEILLANCASAIHQFWTQGRHFFKLGGRHNALAGRSLCSLWFGACS